MMTRPGPGPGVTLSLRIHDCNFNTTEEVLAENQETAQYEAQKHAELVNEQQNGAWNFEHLFILVLQRRSLILA